MRVQHVDKGYRAGRLFVILTLTFVIYTFAYLAQPALPGNSAYPLGWWGWFDQGQYFASAKAFAQGSWRSFDHFYPPAYPWVGSLFIGMWPANPFFLADYVGLAATLASLYVVGARLCGERVVIVAVAATFVLFPLITATQWEIPWTTSMSAGIGAVLVLGLDHVSSNIWKVQRAGNWMVLALCSFSYGALFAVRPLDVLVWFPVAAALFVPPLWVNLKSGSSSPGRARAVRLLIVISVFGLSAPALYIYFNEVTSGSILGSYLVRAGANGYEFHSILRKAVSILLDSSPVYYEHGQALANRYWLLYPAVPCCIYACMRAPMVVRAIVAALILQYAVYIPYCDLLPNGMFRYFNVHYFTWTFPWLSTLTLWSIQDVCRMKMGRSRSVGAALAITGLSACLALIGLKARAVGRASVASTGEHQIDVTLDRSRRIDFIDISGVHGSWESIYLGNHALLVDGVPLSKISMFRLLPTATGIRLLLLRTMPAKVLALTLDPTTSVSTDVLAAQAANVGLSLTCRVSASCDVPPSLPLVDGPLDLSLADASADAFLLSGWYPIEPWGRWSSSTDAVAGFRVSHPHDVELSASLQPLWSPSHPQGAVKVLANGCAIGSVDFASLSDAGSKRFTGSIPAACILPDGRVDLDFRVDRTVTPNAIGLGEDRRAIGVGVRSLRID